MPRKAGRGEPPPPAAAPTPAATSGLAVTLDVEPRRPRLAWHGMALREAAVAAPPEVIEVVRPAAVRRGAQARKAPRSGDLPPDEPPVNRLIWASDNLVALEGLLEERDPLTREHRYRGKVDLVYIDPPFMANNDFSADSAVDIELGEEARSGRREAPSPVAIPAYKDRWHRGLDSFLSMLRARLALLRALLAPTGSIYVHLDWHAVHYVKVLMDEIFGHETFLNEIVWKRSTSHNDLAQGARHLGRLHDTILVYGRTESPFMAPVFAPYDAAYVRSHYKNKDPDGRRFQYYRITAPGGAAKGNAYYDLLGHKAHWVYTREKAERLVAEGRIVKPSPLALPRYKSYLDERPGVPLQDIWADIAPVNSMARASLAYPTQKPVALLERIIALSCPPGGLVLDGFLGSGTTAEAAERLGRRWIGIDSGKYAIYLARKRLILLDGERRTPAAPAVDYLECATCGNVERRGRPKQPRAEVHVRPFTVEVAGVAIPRFYAALSIEIGHEVHGRTARVTLERCEIDRGALLESQRPPRREALERWLARPTSWQKLIDGWAVDRDYGRRAGADGQPIFEASWEALRAPRGKGAAAPLALTAEITYDGPGQYRVAARVTDVFGNDGFATVTVEVH